MERKPGEDGRPLDSEAASRKVEPKKRGKGRVAEHLNLARIKPNISVLVITLARVTSYFLLPEADIRCKKIVANRVL
jgi:hypothetical protein